ncbi:MAG: hypothetical protein V1738_05885 [Patescibacteria group bacterium]
MSKIATGPIDALERDVLAAAKKQLGKNFVSLIAIGSRATQDHLPDSDLDAYLFVRDLKITALDFSALERQYGVRIGVSVKLLAALKHGQCNFEVESEMIFCDSSRIGMRRGQTRTIGGRNLVETLPPLKDLLQRDIIGELQQDYDFAVRKDSRANVFKREPRRQVGVIIALCQNLLAAKGVYVRKVELPEAMRKYHPRFRVIGLLRRALKRRQHWPSLHIDRKQRAEIQQDAKNFLAAYGKYVFAL